MIRLREAANGTYTVLKKDRHQTEAILAAGLSLGEAMALKAQHSLPTIRQMLNRMNHGHASILRAILSNTPLGAGQSPSIMLGIIRCRRTLIHWGCLDRDAVTERGHDAWSCDLLPSATPGPHFQQDVLEVLDRGWGLAIFHPPCTHLAVSGARHFSAKRADGRQQAALEFVRALLAAPIPRICLENPVSIISSAIRKPDQIIQPWQFGHPEQKATCLWLKGLPRLVPTKILEPTTYGCRCGHRFPYTLGKHGCPNCEGDSGPARVIWDNQTPSGQNKLGPSSDRWAKRSATYRGIAEAMADQWGSLPPLIGHGSPDLFAGV